MLTDEQALAVDAFADVHAGRRRRLTLGGFAGTGKTTVIRAIVERYGTRGLAVCAPTGKAAHVLRSKGVDGACTLHSLIYTPRGTNEKGEVVFARTRGEVPRVAIVDEASLLSVQLVRDLEKLVRNVLYVGDHGQLEPVGDDPGLMHDPDIRLEAIHRQAEGSPIIAFAHHVRRGYKPDSFGDAARVQRGWTADLADFDVVLVGFNDSRRKVNAWVREQRGFGGKLPQVGEQIICLRNSSDHEVWNGMTATVRTIDASRCRMTVDTDDGPRGNVPFDPSQFDAATVKPYERGRKGQSVPTLWDFGYAVTVHKYQGSEAARVAVVEELHSDWSASRWRYTAATRASEELRWVYK